MSSMSSRCVNDRVASAATARNASRERCVATMMIPRNARTSPDYGTIIQRIAAPVKELHRIRLSVLRSALRQCILDTDGKTVSWHEQRCAAMRKPTVEAAQGCMLQAVGAAMVTKHPLTPF